MTPRPRYEESLGFLRRWSTIGPWVLTAICPRNKKYIITKSFFPGALNEKDLLAWLRDQGTAKQRNIYFTVNPVQHQVSKKPSREDIKELGWLHVDIDPRAGEDLAAEQKRILPLLTTDLPEGVPPPTVVLFSGGGYQGFWRLNEPFPIKGQQAEYERAALWNRQLEFRFEADSCHNVDRIMRLPGTINFPDNKKKAKGRSEALAKLIVWQEGLSYDLDEFESAQPPAQERRDFTGQVNVGKDIQRLVTIDELPAGVSELCRTVIVQGYDPDNPDKFSGDRSRWLFWVCCELVRASIPDEMVFSVITDKKFDISKSVLDKGRRTEAYALRQIGRAHEYAIHPALMELNESHAVISSIGGKCRIVSEEPDPVAGRTRITFQSFEDFRNRYCNRRIETVNASGNAGHVPLGQWWINHPQRRQHKTIVFAPGFDVSDSYNLWRGFGYDAIKGNCDLFLAHLKDNVCGGHESHYAYLLGWMATAVQKPAQPGHVAIVMRGRMGTGKSFFAKTFGQLFGRHFLRVSDPKHLVGSFNAHLRDCVILFGDEAFYAGDKKHESVLKMMITEEQLVIEPKGVDVIAAPNFVHLILASNSTWVVPAGFDERRFFMLDVADSQIQDRRYFGAIQAQLNAGGFEALLFMLMHHDISSFDIRAIPQTSALQEQKVYSFSPEEEWWYAKLVNGELIEGQGWVKHVFASSLVHDFASYARLWNLSQRSNSTRLGRFMQRACPNGHALRAQLSGVHELVGPSGETLRVDRPRVYVIPPLPACRQHWDECFGGPYKWDDPVIVKREEAKQPF